MAEHSCSSLWSPLASSRASGFIESLIKLFRTEHMTNEENQPAQPPSSLPESRPQNERGPQGHDGDSKQFRKEKRFMKPFKQQKQRKTNKEIIINAEALEKRAAVLENGQLEEYHIERTTEQR